MLNESEPNAKPLNVIFFNIPELSVLDPLLKSLSITGIQAGSQASFETINQFVAARHIKPIIDQSSSPAQYNEAFS